MRHCGAGDRHLRGRVLELRAVGLIAGTLLASFAVGCAPDPDDRLGAPTTAPITADAPGGPAAAPPTGAPERVVAIDNTFLPERLEIAAGTEVVFENNGRNDHNVLPAGDAQALAWGVQVDRFAPKDTYSHVFDAPGTYRYYCSIHGTDAVGMVGTIVVTNP